jgi:hypothetical protein
MSSNILVISNSLLACEVEEFCDFENVLFCFAHYSNKDVHITRIVEIVDSFNKSEK